MTGQTNLLHLSTAPHIKTCKVLLIYSTKCPTFSTIQSYAPPCALSLVSSLNLKSNLLVKRFLFLLNAAFYTAILDLISRVYLVSLVSKLPKSWNILHSPVVLAIIICTGDSCLEILFALVFSAFLSIPQPLRASIYQSCPTVLFLLQITAIIKNSYRHIN